MKLSEIAQSLSADILGDRSLVVDRLVHPADAAGPGDLAVALSKEAIAALAGCRAGAVVVPPGVSLPPDGPAALVYTGPERQALAILTSLFDHRPTSADGIHPTAVVAADAVIGRAVRLGPHAVVGNRSSIGDGATLMAGVIVGAEVRVGQACVVHPGAVIGDRVEIGDRTVIHANAVIGGDGFGFVPVRQADGTPGAEGKPLRIHSLGTVIIGDDVEIGAGTTIDRATLRATRIGNATKIDNQVQIGHNVTIGEGCLICGKAGIAGSVTIGDRVLVGAGVGISDHVTVGSDAAIGASSGVAQTVPAGASVLGMPAVPIAQWREQFGRLLRLKKLYATVADLEKHLAALEKAGKEG